jgi:uncharacterized protein (DUF1499 family)
MMGLLTGNRPAGLGKMKADDGTMRLHPVKTKLTNAVSSFESLGYHAIAPIAAPNPGAVWAKLEKTVRAMPGAKVIAHEADYLYAEFTTKLLGFVDDVEFMLDATHKRIHVRSASRLGRKDFNVNRQRIEAIRRQVT